MWTEAGGKGYYAGVARLYGERYLSGRSSYQKIRKTKRSNGNGGGAGGGKTGGIGRDFTEIFKWTLTSSFACGLSTGWRSTRGCVINQQFANDSKEFANSEKRFANDSKEFANSKNSSPTTPKSSPTKRKKQPKKSIKEKSSWKLKEPSANLLLLIQRWQLRK